MRNYRRPQLTLLAILITGLLASCGSGADNGGNLPQGNYFDNVKAQNSNVNKNTSDKDHQGDADKKKEEKPVIPPLDPANYTITQTGLTPPVSTSGGINYPQGVEEGSQNFGALNAQNDHFGNLASEKAFNDYFSTSNPVINSGIEGAVNLSDFSQVPHEKEILGFTTKSNTPSLFFSGFSGAYTGQGSIFLSADNNSTEVSFETPKALNNLAHADAVKYFQGQNSSVGLVTDAWSNQAAELKSPKLVHQPIFVNGKFDDKNNSVTSKDTTQVNGFFQVQALGAPRGATSGPALIPEANLAVAPLTDGSGKASLTAGQALEKLYAANRPGVIVIGANLDQDTSSTFATSHELKDGQAEHGLATFDQGTLDSLNKSLANLSAKNDSPLVVIGTGSYSEAALKTIVNSNQALHYVSNPSQKVTRSTEATDAEYEPAGFADDASAAPAGNNGASGSAASGANAGSNEAGAANDNGNAASQKPYVSPLLTDPQAGVILDTSSSLFSLLQNPKAEQNLLVVGSVYQSNTGAEKQLQRDYLKSLLDNSASQEAKDAANKSVTIDNGVSSSSSHYSAYKVIPNLATTALGTFQCGVAMMDCVVAPAASFFPFVNNSKDASYVPKTVSEQIAYNVFKGHFGDASADDPTKGVGGTGLNYNQAKFGNQFSVAYVGAVAALVKQQFPWFTAANLKQTILTTATPVPIARDDYRVNNAFGWGIINADKALKGPAMFYDGQFVADMQHKDFFEANYEHLNPNTTYNHRSYFTNDISGKGGLYLSGSDKDYLYLTGNNTYTGNTTVASGTLVITDGKSLGINENPTVVGSSPLYVVSNQANLVLHNFHSTVTSSTAKGLTVPYGNVTLVGSHFQSNVLLGQDSRVNVVLSKNNETANYIEGQLLPSGAKLNIIQDPKQKGLSFIPSSGASYDVFYSGLTITSNFNTTVTAANDNGLFDYKVELVDLHGKSDDYNSKIVVTANQKTAREVAASLGQHLGNIDSELVVSGASNFAKIYNRANREIPPNNKPVQPKAPTIAYNGLNIDTSGNGDKAKKDSPLSKVSPIFSNLDIAGNKGKLSVTAPDPIRRITKVIPGGAASHAGSASQAAASSTTPDSASIPAKPGVVVSPAKAGTNSTGLEAAGKQTAQNNQAATPSADNKATPAAENKAAPAATADNTKPATAQDGKATAATTETSKPATAQAQDSKATAANQPTSAQDSKEITNLLDQAHAKNSKLDPKLASLDPAAQGSGSNGVKLAQGSGIGHELIALTPAQKAVSQAQSFTKSQLTRFMIASTATAYNNYQIATVDQVREQLDRFSHVAGTRLEGDNELGHVYVNTNLIATNYKDTTDTNIRGKETGKSVAIGYYNQTNNHNLGVLGYYQRSNWHEDFHNFQISDNDPVGEGLGKGAANTFGGAILYSAINPLGYYTLVGHLDYSKYDITRTSLYSFDQKGQLVTYDMGVSGLLGRLVWSNAAQNMGVLMNYGISFNIHHQNAFNETAVVSPYTANLSRAQQQSQVEQSELFSLKTQKYNNIAAFITIGAKYYANFNLFGFEQQLSARLDFTQDVVSQDFSLKLLDNTHTGVAFQNLFQTQFTGNYRIALSNQLDVDLQGRMILAKSWHTYDFSTMITYKF